MTFEDYWCEVVDGQRTDGVYTLDQVRDIARLAYAVGGIDEREACAETADCFVNGGIEIARAIRDRSKSCPT